MPSLFLSHSSRDDAHAERLCNLLKSAGYQSLFLDIDPEFGIPAGRNWEQELYRKILASEGMLVLCSEQYLASKWCFVEVAYAKALRKPIFTVRLGLSNLPDILNENQSVDFTSNGETAFNSLLKGLISAGIDPKDSFSLRPGRPPFPGLDAFEKDDVGVFLGRSAEIQAALATLNRMRSQEGPRVALVLGASGSGKSSLVRAGVLPRLEKDPERWVIVDPFRPRDEPFLELAKALVQAYPEGRERPDWATLRNELARVAIPDPPPGTRVLAEQADQGNRRGEQCSRSHALAEKCTNLAMDLGRREAAVLITIDQAEQLLLRDELATSANAFLRFLRDAIETPGSPVFVLATLRSDYLGAWQSHTELHGLPFENLSLGPMALENLPQIIAGPARLGEIEFQEESLVSEIAADARTGDALPLLAFTMRAMYDRTRPPRVFTRELYNNGLGRIQGSVEVVVNEVRNSLGLAPGSNAEKALRRAFLRLVRIDDQGRYIGKSAPWHSLPVDSYPALNKMVEARLLTRKGDRGESATIEVAHESLFRVWTELANWLNDKRELLLWKQAIQDDLAAWKKRGKAPTALLSGDRAAEARQKLATDLEEFDPDEILFLQASVAEEERKVEERQRLFRRVRIAAVVAGILALVSSGLGLWAYVKSVQASEAAKVAESRRRAALAEALASRSLDSALLLAIEATRFDTLEARSCLLTVLKSRPEISRFHFVPEGIANCVAFSADGRIDAAYGGAAKGVVRFDKEGKRFDHKALNVEGDVSAVAFGSDGLIAIGYASRGTHGNHDGGLALFNATGERLFQQSLELDPFQDVSIAIAPDRRIAAGSRGQVMMFDPDGKRPVGKPLEIKEAIVSSLAFDKSGRLAVGYFTSKSASGGVAFFDKDGNRLAGASVKVEEGEVTTVAWDQTGRIAAGYSGTFGNVRGEGVLLFDAAGKTPRSSQITEGVVTSLAFGPRGQVAAGYKVRGVNVGGGVVLFDEHGNRTSPTSLEVKEGYVHSVAFGPQGHIAAAYGALGAGGVVLFDVAKKRLRPTEIRVPQAHLTSVAYGPKGLIVAGYWSTTDHGTFGKDGGVVLFDSEGKRLPRSPLIVKEGNVTKLAVSPDGRIAAGYSIPKEDTRFGNGGVVLFDSEGNRLTADPLVVEEGTVTSVAFGPNGQIAAGFFSADSKGGVVIFDATGRRVLGVPDGGVLSVAFSTEGSVAAGFGGEDRGGVVLFDASGNRSEALEVPEGLVFSVAFGPEGRIAVGYGDTREGANGGLVVFDKRLKRIAHWPLAISQAGVWSVAFDRDGWIAAGYGYAGLRNVVNDVVGGVVLFDRDGRRLRPDLLEVHGAPVMSVAFDGDDQIAAACSPFNAVNEVVRVDASLNSWRRNAGRTANRNLTLAEWKQYYLESPYRRTVRSLPWPHDLLGKEREDAEKWEKANPEKDNL
jgi:TIR domain/AAA ATPase domain